MQVSKLSAAENKSRNLLIKALETNVEELTICFQQILHKILSE